MKFSLLKNIVPAGVWLFCICFFDACKNKYVSAVPGCMTQDQMRRQARDRGFLPQPPPPPLLEVPRRRSAWADFPIGLEFDDSVVTTIERATQCDPTCLSETVEPPLSG